MDFDADTRPDDLPNPDDALTPDELAEAYGLAQLAEPDYAETEAVIRAAEECAARIH